MVSSILLAFVFSFQVSASNLSMITGRVTDPSGAPVRNATVTAIAGGHSVAIASTDIDGRFTLPASLERVDIFVSAPGLRVKPIHLAAGGARALTIVMELAAIADTVVVSAAHAEIPLARATDSITVISGEEIRARQQETVADALRLTAGIGVTASGSRGAVTSLFTRGGESDYTLVLVDGVPINEFGGAVDLSHVSPAGIDRIEVVRGPQGALHGAGAIAGVIHVISAEGGPARAAAQVEAGSDAFRRFGGDARGASSGWSFGGGVDFVASDGFTGRTAAGETVSNDDYERVEASAVASRTLAGHARVRATVRWNDAERGFPGPFGSNPAGNFSGVDTISRGLNDRLAASGSIAGSTGAISHRAHATWMRLESDFVSPFGESSSSTRRAVGRYIADWTRAGSGVTGISAGADAAVESGRSTFIVNRSNAAIPIERMLAGFFAEARGTAGTRAIFTLGARADRIHRNALEGNDSPFSPRPDMAAETIWSFNPRVSAAVYLTPPDARQTTRLRASFSTGIKPPTAFELSSTDNPRLAPERNRAAEAGIEQTFASGMAVLGASAFWNRFDDLIITVGSLSNASPYRSDNLSNSKASGLELTGAIRGSGRFAGLSVRAGYTLLETEILAADDSDVTGLAPFVVGDRLLRRPRHRGFVDLGYTTDRFDLFVNVDARGRTLDVEPSFGLFGGLYDNGGFATASTGATWTFGDHLSIFGRVTNLFDRGYEEIFGFPSPGRRFAVGARVASRR